MHGAQKDGLIDMLFGVVCIASVCRMTMRTTRTCEATSHFRPRASAEFFPP
jgi:hypothetical protein